MLIVFLPVRGVATSRCITRSDDHVRGEGSEDRCDIIKVDQWSVLKHGCATEELGLISKEPNFDSSRRCLVPAIESATRMLSTAVTMVDMHDAWRCDP